MSGLEQAIPEGYKQTDVGVIPNDWKASILGEFVHSLEAGISVNSVDKRQAFPHGKHILKTSCVSKGYFYPKEAKSIIPNDISRAKTIPTEGAIIVSRMNTPDLVGELGFIDETYTDLFLPDRLWQMRFRSSLKINTRWLAYILSFPAIAQKIKESATGTSNSMKNISKGSLLSIAFPSPEFEEQTAIANALSDVDALLTELESLIAKKQAIKTATMQQLLTGKTRLPAFAYYSEADENQTLPEGAKHGQRKYSTGTNVNVEACDDGSQSGGMESRRKGTKPSELGEIPEDWEVRAFGQVMRIRHGKDQKAIQVNDGQYPIFGTGGKMGSTNTPLYDKPSVLIGRKGTINKPRFTDRPFWTVDTLFYSEVANKESAKFIYYKFCMIDWMQYNEASGVPSLNASTIESVLASFPEYEEQTAIAAILSDIDEDIQTLEQRLKKTRQIKQGMMQELLTGKTRLPFDKSEVQGVTMEEA
jgi:type I restriction enzyme S subunit